MVQDQETRKGPWMEHEDLQLVGFVGMFGDRRWDFIAKVSGLKRSGKSCRLRWVNYLQPGLKRGKMTPHEERLVLELHSKWGNRWSRIARKLPGRTDNEIKNYWRTHTRKKAQEKNQATSPSSSSSSSNLCSSSSPSIGMKVDSLPFPETGEERFYDTGGPIKKSEKEDGCEGVYSMDDIWKDIALSEESTIITPVYTPMASPEWLWRMDEEECKVLSFCHNQNFICSCM